MRHLVEFETVGLADVTDSAVVVGLGPAKRPQCIVGARGRSRDGLKLEPLEQLAGGQLGVRGASCPVAHRRHGVRAVGRIHITSTREPVIISIIRTGNRE